MTDPLPPPRPTPALLFSAAPLFMALFFISAVGSLVFLVWKGGTAEGERVAITFDGQCAAEGWSALVLGRAREIGLGDPELTTEGSTVRLTATLPGLPDDRAAIPKLLARSGALTFSRAGVAIAGHGDLLGADVTVDEAGMPYTALHFTPEAKARIGAASGVEVTLDGAPRAEWHGDLVEAEATVRLLEDGVDNRERMRRAADDAIVLNHGPLPCAVKVAGVETVR